MLIEGRLKLDQWEKDGQKRSKLKVVGEKMQMLGGREGGGGRSSGPPQSSRPASDYDQYEPAAASAPPEDDIPF